MKKSFLTFFLVGVFFVMVPNIEAFHWCNDICRGFEEGKSGDIENLVIEGSSLYFRANADIMNLYAEAEISPYVEYSYSKSLLLVQSALGYLKESKSKYLQAAQMGIAAGYVESKINLLKTFNYDHFAAKQGLNEAVKNRVKSYLKNGDVIGFYKEVADELDGLMVILTDMEKRLQDGVKPSLPVFWNLLQKLSELTLFGNYGTVMGLTAFGY
jgi:hypothetical protein